MDSRPNVIRKILPCSKRTPLLIDSTSGVTDDTGLFRCYGLPPAVEQHSSYSIGIRPDFKAGSDFTVIGYVAPTIANDTGSDKKVRIIPTYQVARIGSVLGTTITGDVILITIPDGTPAYTVQEISFITIPNLVINDLVGIVITRDATHADDDFAGQLLVPRLISGIYESGQIGIT